MSTPLWHTLLKTLPLRHEFSHLKHSAHAIQKLLDSYEFNSVLDIGCGDGTHADIFSAHDKIVTAIDYGLSPYFKNNTSRIETIVADFNTYDFQTTFDCIWCSHILEHQLNVNMFLRKIFALLNEKGVLAITVPPEKPIIVGGHVSKWNAGLLLYNLVLAGFDCKNSAVLQYGYNISVIIEKSTALLPNTLAYDCGDLRLLQQYFPKGLRYKKSKNDAPFYGNIYRLNW